MIDHPDVLALFTRQHWVAAMRQLEALGVSRFAVGRAARRGTIVTIQRGVYAIAGAEVGFAGRALALQLLVGDDAVVSGPSAAHLHGLRGMPQASIEITAREQRHVSVPAPHRLVLTSWLDEERDVEVRADGLRVASPLRMLFDLARRFNQHRFDRAAEDAWHRQLVTPDDAADYLAAVRRSGRTGVVRFEAWLQRTAAVARPTGSGLEIDFVDIAERAGLPTPVRQHPLRLPSGEVVHLDLAWPDVRLAVEPGHSWWHGGDLRQRADQARDRACAVVGWHVHRYDEAAAEDPAATARELAALYRRRRADLTGSESSDAARRAT